MFWFFGHEACGILAPGPEIEPAPPAVEGEVLTTGPPEKGHLQFFSSLSRSFPQIQIFVWIQPRFCDCLLGLEVV